MMSSSSRIGILASQAKLDRLNEAAELCAKTGNLMKYCEIMIDLNQVSDLHLFFLKDHFGIYLFSFDHFKSKWERALSIAPGVSLSYWQDLVKKYLQYLEEKESGLVLPYSVAVGDIDRLTDHYLKQSQFK